MQSISKYMSQAGSKIAQLDRRIKVGVLLLVVLFLLARSTLMAANFPRLSLWIGVDACAIWRGKHLSLWKPEKEKWWHKLCRLERQMEEIDYQCSDQRWMGNRLVCFEQNLVPRNNCIVYSFGIAFDFTFDDAMAKYGCTVYSFDPSMDKPEHMHAERVHFKPIGLSNKDDDHFTPRMDNYVKTATTWRVRRLATIMKELGHTPGSVTILKVDIESNEWDVVDDILSSQGLFQSIPQVLIEWHLFSGSPPRSRYDDLISIFFRFRDVGFRKFFWQNEGRDHYIGRLSTQAETSWVNYRFLKGTEI